MTLETKLEQEKRNDFIMFQYLPIGTPLEIYNALLTDKVNTGRYENKKDFIRQFYEYRTNLMRR